MINPRETESFDSFYNFVHKHPDGIYHIIFQNGEEISAEYDTDYETDNGLSLDEAGYEEYIAIVFKRTDDNTLFEVSCFNFPIKVLYNMARVI
ncbi:MAG: hypothetical protein IKS10_08125 [Lachnospiraceae bacterium]|nr:hypothetical protein [Lachnospiraceae bacterium]